MRDLDSIWYRVMRFLPYPLLAVPTVLYSIMTSASLNDRLITWGLAALALTWVVVMTTRLKGCFQGARSKKLDVAILVYFVGLLLLSWALMTRDVSFLVFAVTGFFHAFVLRPPVVGFLGIFSFSLLINGMTILTAEPIDAAMLTIFGTVVVVQTCAIGGGIFLQERMDRQHEKRRQTMRKLEEALEENAGLHAQLLIQAREAGILDERQRMAREIHDTLAQGLTGIITQLEAAKRKSDDVHLDNAVRLARESLAEARRSVHAVRPEPLETARLPEAIGLVTDRWSELQKVPVELTTTGTARPLHPDVEVTLLRTAQEALANIAKHARADRVGLTLSYMEDLVTLDVRDDGAGFHPDQVVGADGSGGFGLTGMRQRVRRLAGTLSIESEPGQGTAISASVPAIPAVTDTVADTLADTVAEAEVAR